MNYAGDATPSEAYAALAADPAASLVDVRTAAELAFVGTPELASLGKTVLNVPWHPHLRQDELVAQLEEIGLDRDDPVFFICRSGARSLNAAVLATHGGYQKAFNVSGGFEGPVDAAGHRGTVVGWKVEGLPWRQS